MNQAAPAKPAGKPRAKSTLQAKNLVKKIRGKTIVDGVSLHVSSGEVVGLLGPNGAGKTTSFNMMIGLIRHNEGQILLDNTPLDDMAMHDRARKGIGYLPQEPSIFRRLTVEENILAVLEATNKGNPESRKKFAMAMLKEFGVDHKQHAMGVTLSGGERRRVEIARAVALEPSFILLDEPFAGIDPLSVKDIQRVIRMLQQRGIGVLITDHNVRETLGICNRAYILTAGKVLVGGTPSEILQDERARSAYLGDDFRL
ncbi:MAG: lipopolysaccharide export system ATP-binding protein [Gammaproteobacteria bacterium]|jgi:lipopolysaccharide export system ATP-binding protein